MKLTIIHENSYDINVTRYNRSRFQFDDIVADKEGE